MRFSLHSFRNPQDALPELAVLTPAQRREIWQAASGRAMRRWQVGVSACAANVANFAVICLVRWSFRVQGWVGLLALSATVGAFMGLPLSVVLRHSIRAVVRELLDERAGPSVAPGPQDETIWPPAPRQQ